jgi:Cu+-exporting ATPase
VTTVRDPIPPTETTLSVSGMSCASCVAHVERSARREPGVEAARVNLARGRAVVRFDPSRTDPARIAAAISAAGYPAEEEHVPSDALAASNAELARLNRQQAHASAWLRRAVVGLALWLPVEVLHWVFHFRSHGPARELGWIDWLALAFSTISLVYVGAAFYRNAWAALKRGTSDMDTLIAMGASVAYAYSLTAMLGHLLLGWPLAELYFMESTGLLALISLGHWLEARARATAGRAIHELLELAPATALRLPPSPRTRGEGWGEGSSEVASSTQEVPVSELQIGDRILVRPGDRIPIDGTVVAGRSTVDESMISGEPLPVTRTPGDNVIGGTINIDGALQVRVTRTGNETALAQIVRLVEHAQSTRPAVQRLADRISAVFVPVVLLIALLTGIGWYVAGQVRGWDDATTWGKLAQAVCSVLIIACPCALGLAVPAALMVGTGRGAKLGILFRDIDALQQAERIDTVVLDKTGTLTRGKPIVGEITPLAGVADHELLALAASAELFSEHPLGKAIVSAARERGLKVPEPASFTSEAGLGVVADVSGQTLLVGSEDFVIARGGTASMQQRKGVHATVGTRVHVARQLNGSVQPIGILTITDELKPDSADAVAQLHALGLRTVLLTGDNRETAEHIAGRVGIDDIRAGVKPDGKAAAIAELQNRKSAIANRQSKVAMVGDGINDAPALAQADLGIAIGSGSDIAKETGGIVLVGDSLRAVAASIRLSRATMTKVRQNLFLAFIYNVLAIPLAALGMLNPLIAAAAMALSDVTVIGNALLLRHARIDR